MIPSNDDGGKMDQLHQEEGGIYGIKWEVESRALDEKGPLKIQKDQEHSKRRKLSSRGSSSESEFENKLGKRFHPSNTEFKVHFYTRRVHMNGMSENEFLQFIKRKVNLAGQCDVVQMFNQNGQYCDVAIGMSNDDNAKLVYLGKKHFNFGRSYRQKDMLGRQKEMIELSEAFKSYLDSKNLLDKEHLERTLRRNQQSRGRSESSESSRRYKSRSISKRKKKQKTEKKRSSRSSSSDRKQKRRRGRHTSHSSSRSRSRKSKESIVPPKEVIAPPYTLLPLKPMPVFTEKCTIYIFALPLEFTAQSVIQEITNTYKLPAPISHIWNTSEKMSYLEMQFADESTAMALQQLRPCFCVQEIPLLVIGKKQNRTVQELLRNNEVQVEVDKDVQAFTVVQEFKRFGELIGIYAFQQNRNYLLLFSNSTQLQETLRPPVQLQLHIEGQNVLVNAKIIDKAIDIQRPYLRETLAFQLKNPQGNLEVNEDDEDFKNKKNRKYKSADKNKKK